MFFKQISDVQTIIRIAATGLLSGVALSWPLWNPAERFWFPLLPLWGEAENPHLMNGLFHTFGWLGLFALMVAVFVFPGKKLLTGLLAGWLAGLCAFDLNRLQPWVWLYLIVFTVTIVENEKGTVVALRWLLAGVYFWSGFYKLTPYFAEDNFPWFCEAFSFTQPLGRYPLLGYGIALLEMVFGAGLFRGKTRSWFKWLVIGFHAVIILFLLKLDWNLVVIPWNLAMAGLVWILFTGAHPASSPEGRKVSLTSGKTIAGGFVWLAPLFGLFNLWPHTLSWQLYANTQPEATFYADNSFSLPTKEVAQVWERYAFDDGTKLLLDDWANSELKVPMFASRRAFRQMGEYLCTQIVADSSGLYILTVNRWNKSAERMEKIPCGETMNDE